MPNPSGQPCCVVLAGVPALPWPAARRLVFLGPASSCHSLSPVALRTLFQSKVLTATDGQVLQEHKGIRATMWAAG